MRKLFTLTLALLGSFSLWAADPDVVAEFSSTTLATYFKDYVIDASTTVTLSTSAGSISSGNGGYYIDLSSESSAFNTNYLSVKVSKGTVTIDSVKILSTGSGNSKSITAPVVGWDEGWDGSSTTADHGQTLSYSTPSSNGGKYSTAEWRKIDVSSWESQEIRLYKKLKTVTVTDYTLPTSGETVRLWGVKVWLHPACATTISTQPSGATIALGDANPELSIVATNADSYAWKESSDGTSYDGASTLGTEDEFTPEVNDAVQTKYYYCEVTSSCDGTTVVKSNIVTVNVVASISYYTITLNPAGGTITDATGWTLNAGKYEKEVADGTEVTMPTFTKDSRTFKTWRNNADVDVASPITITKDTILTAVWTKQIKHVIYSWEGAEGGANEVGGTAKSTEDGGDNFNNKQINVSQSGYYCLQMNGGDGYADNYVEIDLDEALKTGDSIIYTGFYSNSKTKNAAPKMRDGANSNTQIFAGSNLPNINSASPRTDKHKVTATINTTKVQLTRHQTGSSSFLTNLEFFRYDAVEEANIATITFNSNGGSSVASIEVIKGNAASKPADPTKAGSTFTGWYLNDVAYDWSSTVSADITLVAHWAEAYTVVYFNGADTLGVEAVAVGSHPTASAITSARECYTFNGWKYNDAFVTLNTFAGESGAKYDFIGNWTANYAKSINLEDSVLTYGKKYGYAAALSAANISSAGADALDSIGNSKDYRNYPFLGLKYKTSTGIGILVKQGSTLRVRFGNVGANVTVTINGANAETKTSAQLANTHTDSTRVYEYTATSADALVKFTYSNSSALVLKQVMIDKEIVRVHIPALYTVTYNAGAGTCATETASVEFSTDKVILPEIATLPEGMQFDGWYDAATSGTLVGLAGAEYTPSANITLYAYYSKATALDNTAEETKAIKRIENGQVVIFKDGKYFNVLGIQIR